MAQREPVSVLLYRLQQHLQGISEIVGELADQLAEPSAEAKSLGSSQREFLNERQMAEYLGITKRALEGRRYRGQFPADVCVMIEGNGSTAFPGMRSGLKACGLFNPRRP